MKMIFSIIIALLFMGGCDPIVTFPLDGSKEKELDFKCGSLSIKAVKSLGQGLIFNLNFNLKDEVQINLDSLKVLHKGSDIQYNILDAKNRTDVNENTILLQGNKIINISITQKINNLDTLTIYMENFINCQGASIYNDPITVIL